MNILISLTYYRPHYSGLTIYAEREAHALVQRGHHVTILTSRFDRNLPAHEYQDGVEIIRLDVWMRISKGVIMPGVIPWAWKLVQQADVVHVHVPQLDAAPIAVIHAYFQKTPDADLSLRFTPTSSFIHSLANQGSNLANQVTARAANLIVANTLDYAQQSKFLKPYLHKLRAVYPPVEVSAITEQDREAFRRKYHIQPEQRIIGMAARLATEKGVEFLTEAMPKVIEQHPTARVLFVGPYQNVVGEERYPRKLAPLIEALGEHWSFLGVASPVEMAAFFYESELTVLPSINSTESFGIVQVKSMFCRTPVVASNLPGITRPGPNYWRWPDRSARRCKRSGGGNHQNFR